MINQPRTKSYAKSVIVMDTVVVIQVVTSQPETLVEASLKQALATFRRVEDVCSRFNPQSELSRLSLRIGEAIPVSDLIFEALRFAWEVADSTSGTFDPTIGGKLIAGGFNKNYLTGHRNEAPSDPSANYRNISLDPQRRTVKLEKPLVLDLGAIAKGLAVDLAAKFLTRFEGFMIDAGGDIFASGRNEHNEPWRVGIRHPLRKNELTATLQVSGQAVCTSGSYERPSPLKPGLHHLIEPRSGLSQAQVLSCTVVAPFAMMADGFSTAAFILGKHEGLKKLEETDLDGLFITPTMEIAMTPGMRRYLA